MKAAETIERLINTRILGVLPMVYAVMWKKNIYLGIFVHCLMNTIATISMIGFVLGKI